MRFHAVYWPAFLMSAGLQLPKQVFGHGFLLHTRREDVQVGRQCRRSARSRRAFGVDRCAISCCATSASARTAATAPRRSSPVNADLANSFGNLAQRTLSFIAKNCGGVLPRREGRRRRRALFALVARADSELPAHFEALALSQGIEAWLRAVFACNQYIDAQAPWALRKTDPERMNAVLATLYEAITDLAIAIQPVIPAAARLLDPMGIPATERDFAALVADRESYARLAAAGFVLQAPAGPCFRGSRRRRQPLIRGSASRRFAACCSLARLRQRANAAANTQRNVASRRRLRRHRPARRPAANATEAGADESARRRTPAWRASRRRSGAPMSSAIATAATAATRRPTISKPIGSAAARRTTGWKRGGPQG